LLWVIIISLLIFCFAIFVAELVGTDNILMAHYYVPYKHMSLRQKTPMSGNTPMFFFDGEAFVRRPN
jgi:hypothetical protein